MARIYVSSTFGDLKNHREQVYRTLRQLGHDVVAMEDYVATDQRPLAKCLEDVAACDLYVGVFAHRYGYIPKEEGNPEGRSITELEYRHAQAKGKPCLVFMLDPEAPWPPTAMDSFTRENESGGRIQLFREELSCDRLVSFFATAEELAQKVSVAVTNQLNEKAVTRQPPVPSGRGWTIPPPVRSFTGRDDQLAALRHQLIKRGVATLVPTAALTGMGGIGKTQLALTYAHRHRGDYTLGWWVPAETELSMLNALAELGAVLGLPDQLPPAELAALTRAALGDRSGWLLIFDNAPNLAAIADYLPGAGVGHVLITSRDSAWQGIAEPVPVDLLALEDAVELLVRRTGDADQQSASRLAEALGRLPLALEQAAAYMSSQRLSLGRYLELFEERRVDLLALGRPLAYQGTVDATFTLAREQLQAANPAAVQLLELCALLAPDEIPLPLLLREPTLLPEPLAGATADPLRRAEVAGALYQQGLLSRDVDDNARIHRLVQTITLAHLPEADRHQRIVDTVGLLAELFPVAGGEPDQWPRCSQLVTHAQLLLDHAQQPPLISHEVGRLLNSVGIYLWSRGLDIRLAHELYEEALAVRRRLHQGDHPDVAASLHGLATVLHGLGDYGRARELNEEALAMRRRLYQGDHPDVAASLQGLATVLRGLGDRGRARELNEEALELLQRLYQGDHPDVAASLQGLATALSHLGDYGRARELYEEALAMRRRLHQGDHPDVAANLHGLASAINNLGDHERARELNEEALELLQRLYQGDHPRVAASLTNLATVQSELGDHERARELDKEALEMHRRLYQGDHPRVALSLTNLAIDLRELGDHGRARELDEEALEMHRRLAERAGSF